MLDAQELAKRLRAAMDLREPPLAQVELATLCGVSKQAVYEWRTTGRIGKNHLIAIATATGMPLAYYLEVERGQSAETKKIWSRLGKMFAKAALVAVVSFTLPPKPAEAAFNIIISRSTHCVRRFWTAMLYFLPKSRFPYRLLTRCGMTTQ